MQRGTVVTIVGLLVLAAIFVVIGVTADATWLWAAAVVVAIGAVVVLLLRFNTPDR